MEACEVRRGVRNGPSAGACAGRDAPLASIVLMRPEVCAIERSSTNTAFSAERRRRKEEEAEEEEEEEAIFLAPKTN